MDNFRLGCTSRLFVCITASISLILGTTVAFAGVDIPDDTTVYLTTTETIIGKKSKTSVGQVVRARVWRDVVVDGQILIKGGTRATVKVANIKSRGIFGITSLVHRRVGGRF